MDSPTMSSVEISSAPDTVQVPVTALLQALVHSSYKDRGSIPVPLAPVLEQHPSHGVLYQIEQEFSGGYVIWTIEAWKQYVVCEKSWTTYTDTFFAEQKRRAMQGSAGVEKKPTINQRIKQLEAKGDIAMSSILKGLFKDL